MLVSRHHFGRLVVLLEVISLDSQFLFSSSFSAGISSNVLPVHACA
jgi:hypothetical protein